MEKKKKSEIERERLRIEISYDEYRNEMEISNKCCKKRTPITVRLTIANSL
jgi:hypothetical protein